MHTTHAHKRHHHHPDHPALPSDATIGHDQDVLAKLQAYVDQNNPDQLQVEGYATSPNPSADGDYFRDASELIFYWYKDQPDTISMADAAPYVA